MRREWSAWIKTRQWSEFEKLAKQEPSQILADTVAELERGIGDKQDRRALRKIQYLLQQAGYRATPIEEHFGEDGAPTKVTFEASLMSVSDSSGFSACVLGIQKGPRVRWLQATLSPFRGIVQARESETTVVEAPDRFARFLTEDFQGWTIAAVPPSFAKGRLNTALHRSNEALPSLIAFWRTSFEGVDEGRHPAENLARTQVSADDLARVALTMDGPREWRLELGTVAPVVERLAEVFQSTGEAEERRNRADEAMKESCLEIFTPEVILDHSTRLLDLAYLRSLRREMDVPFLVAAADELREQGPESTYARALLDKTVSAFLVALNERNEPQ